MYSAAFRAKARAVLRNHWQTALLIALIVNLPSLLMQGLGVFTNTDPLTRVQALLLDASYGRFPMEDLPRRLQELFSQSGVLAMGALGILAWLITPALSLGMNHWALDRVRNLEEPVTTVFSRMRIFLKGIGLRVLTVLLVLLWMLPGIAVGVISFLPVMRGGITTEQAAVSALNTSMILLYVSLLLMMVFGIMGYLRYALADFILADEPEEGVRRCLRRSREMMAGRRSLLFSLLLSFLLWYFLISIVSSFAAGIAGDVFGLLIQMLGGLFLSVYMLTSQAVFYEALRLALHRAAEEGIIEPEESDVE